MAKYGSKTAKKYIFPKYLKDYFRDYFLERSWGFPRWSCRDFGGLKGDLGAEDDLVGDGDDGGDERRDNFAAEEPRGQAASKTIKWFVAVPL